MELHLASCLRHGLAKHSSSLHVGGILPIEVVQNTRRKNSADIALVIDVMLAACTNSVEEFCIVSSDGDYTRLALTLCEMGKRVVVVGRATTPSSLRSACTEFINLDELSNPSPQTSLRNNRVARLFLPPKKEARESEPTQPSRRYLPAWIAMVEDSLHVVYQSLYKSRSLTSFL